MRLPGRKTSFPAKPPLGAVLNGQSSLHQGLKLGVILNEDATTGPIIAGSGPNAKVYDIRKRVIGNGVGNLGPSAPTQNWNTSLQGRAFRNMGAGTAGALDFGALSTFGSFSSISFAVMAAIDQAHTTAARTFICSNGSTGIWGVDSIQASTHWETFVVTTGGTQVVNGTPSHNTNGLYCDLVVVTYDGITLKCYINGRLNASSTINQALSLDSTGHVFLSGWQGANNQNHVAPITCAYLWNRVITPAEVQQLYLDPYGVLVYSPRLWTGAFVLPPTPPPPSTPTAAVESPLNARGRTGKSGIKQALIAIPEMQNFDEVRQVMAKAINDLQIHIASQLPVLNHQGQRLQNVGPPVSADDVVTLRYLQSIYNPPGTSTKT